MVFRINFLSRVTSTKYKVCLKPILVKIQAFSNAFQNYNFYLEKVVTKKKKFFRDPFLENNSYIYVYDFPQKNFSMCHGTYSPIPDPSKNWSVKKSFFYQGRITNILYFFQMEGLRV